MDIHKISSRYFVAAQIDPGDIATLADQGFTRVICNRPDTEVPPSHQHAAIHSAAKSAGVEFFYHPLTHATMTPENVAKQQELAAKASGPVLAYCASGTRCSVVWALTQVATQNVDDILHTTRNAGYDLEGLRPTLDACKTDGT